jgi:hypothetical protein
VPVWGGSADFERAFLISTVYLEVLHVRTRDLRPYGEVLPFLNQLS